jgi:neutral ceramidase
MTRIQTMVCCVFFAALSAHAQTGALSAGAARVDITPSKEAALPMSGYAGRGPHQGIHDNLYVRALALDDGATRAAIVSCDILGFPEPVWNALAGRIEREAGIRRENLLLAGVHTHGAPTPGLAAGGPYLALLHDNIVEAVRQASANLKPARAGYGAGRAAVNTNRVARSAQGGWMLGMNPDGVSDKTVAVVKFESLSGEPIALFVNYPVHGTVMGPKNLLITGDLPGATSRFIEQKLGGRTVALWTSGAAGDQNAIYGPGDNFGQVDILGRVLAEEALRVAGGIRTSPRARIRGAQKVAGCPGQRAPKGVSPARDLNIQFEDGPPVDIRLSLVMVGQVAIAGVSGEVLTRIGERLKKESPFTRTMMVTHANGSSGYLPDDDAYQNVSYEIVSSRVKPGCAEAAIVNGLLEMMERQ